MKAISLKLGGAKIFGCLSPDDLGLGRHGVLVPFTGKHSLRWHVKSESTLLTRAMRLAVQHRARGEVVELGVPSELGLHEMGQQAF